MLTMYVLVFALSVIISDKTILLDKDVLEMPTRTMLFPVQYNADRINDLATMDVYFSEDRGKTWKFFKCCTPPESEVRFEAAHDGLFWLALRVTMKDGHSEPADVGNLRAEQKVYINTKKRVSLKVGAQNEDYRTEIADLRAEVRRLQKRIDELEKQKPN
jgi:hypothetical protein